MIIVKRLWVFKTLEVLKTLGTFKAGLNVFYMIRWPVFPGTHGPPPKTCGYNHASPTSGSYGNFLH